MTIKFWKGISVLLVIGFFSIGLMGCTLFTSKVDSQFIKKLNIPISHYLKFTVMGITTIGVNTPITLDVKNTTKQCIVFPHDYGTQIFVYVNNDWSNIPNSVEYQKPDTIGLAPAGSQNSDTVVFVRPNFSSVPVSAYPLQMRIVLAGRLCKGATVDQNPTADYIELTVKNP